MDRNAKIVENIRRKCQRRVEERRSLSHMTNSPSPYQGEGDKGDRVNKNYA